MTTCLFYADAMQQGHSHTMVCAAILDRVTATAMNTCDDDYDDDGDDGGDH